MKVLIDMPQEVLEHPHNYCCYALANQIKGNYTPIPDNATNGDMIKAMFPNATILINVLGSMVNVKYNNHTCWVNYELEWWNAPYKGIEK